MNNRDLLFLLALQVEEIEIYHRHRGNLDANATGYADYYPARPNSSWHTYVQMSFTVSAGTSLRVSWGDAANTSQTIALPIGTTNVQFTYTDAYDTQPENPADPIANHIPREKKVVVVIDDHTAVTGFSVNRMEITRFGTAGFANMNMTSVNLSAQLLTNLPILPSTVTELTAGYDVVGQSNPQTGNAIPFSAVYAATVNNRATLKTMNVGTSVTNGPLLQEFSQKVATAQTYDLHEYTALENLYIQGAKVGKLITTSANAALKIVRDYGLNQTNDILLDVTEFYIPPTLQDLRLGLTNASRATNLATGLALQTARDLTYLDMRYVFADGGHGLSAAVRLKAFYDSVYNLWQNRANHVAGTKTMDWTGNGSVSQSTTEYPSGVTAYINDLIAVGWVSTHTA